jgi:mono/diheme cytochrome c family protein
MAKVKERIGEKMKKILKWFGIVLVALIGLILIVAIVLFIDATVRLNKTYHIQAETVIFPTDPAAIERGKHLADVFCAECHGDNYGGKVFFNVPPIGLINALNLTPGEGGAGSEFTDANWVLAVRHGINPEDKPLVIMPSRERYILSDTDFGEIIAYLKSVPPVNKKWTDPKLTPLGKIMIAAGAFGDIINAETIDHTGPRPVAPAEGVTAEYGGYLVKSFGCTTCHGKDLGGGRDPEPGSPPVPNLTSSGDLGNWTDQDFINTLRTGINPKQHKLTHFMPWKYLGHMTDNELEAVWLYIKSQPPK